MLLLGLVVGLVAAPPPAAAPDVPAPEVERGTRCLTRLQEIVDQLVKLEEVAVKNGDQSQAVCIRRKRNAVAGLRSAMQPVGDRLPVFAEEGKSELLHQALVEITSACTRAEELLVAAQQCAGQTTPSPSPRTGRPIRESAKEIQPVYRQADPATDEPEVSPDAEGPRPKCFRQEQLACLLIRAMELEVAKDTVAMTCIERLVRLGIRPPGDWDGTRCVSLDEFAVVVTQALQVPVEVPGDPASHLQALRDQGLPVERLAPLRTHGEVTQITEARAREFFAGGLAGLFPSLPPLPESAINHRR